LKNIWETDPNQILETANQYLNPKEFEISLAGDI
jgi:hypothetical protein